MNPIELKRLERLAQTPDAVLVGTIRKVKYSPRQKGGSGRSWNSYITFDAEMSRRVAISLRRIAKKVLEGTGSPYAS